MKKKPRLKEPCDIYHEFKGKLEDLKYEECYIGVISSEDDSLVGYELVGRGDRRGSTVDTDSILKVLIEMDPFDYVFLMHNHPNKDAAPSEDDTKITEEVSNICKLLKRKFIDHVIISKNEYFSFKEDLRTRFIK